MHGFLRSLGRSGAAAAVQVGGTRCSAGHGMACPCVLSRLCRQLALTSLLCYAVLLLPWLPLLLLQVPIETLKLRSSDSSSSSPAPAALDALEAAIKQHAAGGQHAGGAVLLSYTFSLGGWGTNE